MVNPILDYLGAGLSTAADAYLRSISPQGELERQMIASQQRMLPLKEAQLQAQTQLAQAHAQHYLKQAQGKQLPTPRDTLVTQGTQGYFTWNPETSKYDYHQHELSRYGEARVQQAIERITRGEGSPEDQAILDYATAAKDRYYPEAGGAYNPYDPLRQRLLPGQPGAVQRPMAPPSPGAPAPAPSVSRPAQPPTSGSARLPVDENLVQQYHQQYQQMPPAAVEEDVRNTLAQDPMAASGKTLSPITLAKIEAQNRLLGLQRPGQATPQAEPGQSAMPRPMPLTPKQEEERRIKDEQLKVQQAQEQTQRDKLAWEKKQPVVQAQMDEVKKVNESAREARTLVDNIAEVELNMNKGFYEQSMALPGALFAHDQFGSGGLTKYNVLMAPFGGGFEEDKLNRTKRIRQLGAQIVSAKGLGNNVSENDRKSYELAAGDFQRAQTLGEMQTAVDSMRRIAQAAMDNANRTLESIQKTGQLPGYEAAPRPTKGTAANPYTDEDIDYTLKQPNAAGMTKQQLIDKLKKDGKYYKAK